MGCNCKNVKKIGNMIPNANHANKDRKGIEKVFYSIFSSIRGILMKIVVALIVVIAVPFVFFAILFSLFFQDAPTVRLPKRVVKSLIKNTNQAI